jgi:hypothetical protein
MIGWVVWYVKREGKEKGCWWRMNERRRRETADRERD